MIRVLHIVGKMDRAGAETMLMNLYRHIDRTQVQFDFITFTTQQGDYDEEILALGGSIFPILAKNPIQRMIKLTSFLEQHSEYRIVHSHMLLSNAFHLLAAKRAGIQHRISHSHSTNNGKSGIIANLYESFTIHLNKNLSTKKIACGKEAAEYLFMTCKNVWILKNAIDLNKYQSVANIYKNYWLNIQESNGLKLIQVGRINTVKNHIFSLEIAKILKEKKINFTFFIVGQGNLENLIIKKIEEYELHKNVFLLGMRSDIAELMAGADIMLMPSLHEGFPVVLVESQAVGLHSIISSNISNEVDLGLGLIDFKPIENSDLWVNELIVHHKKNVSREKILENLQVNGFDVNQNAQELQDFYLSL